MLGRVLRRLTSPLVRYGSVQFFAFDLGKPPPKPAAPPEGISVRIASPEDLDTLLAGRRPRLDPRELRDRFARGDLCFLATDAAGRFVHAFWATRRGAYIPEIGRDVRLGEGEAYWYDGYTRADERGHGAFAMARALACERLEADGCRRLYTYVRGDNPAGVDAARRWERPVGKLRYFSLRAGPTFVFGEVPLRFEPAARPSPAVLPPAIEIETVTDEAGLSKLEPDWSRIAERAGPDHPFLTYEWVRTWWDAFGKGRDLRVLVARRDGECVGIVPLMASRGHVHGVPVRRIELAQDVHTPRGDWLVAEPQAPTLRAIWRALFESRGRWDVLVLPQIEEGSPTLDALGRLASADALATGLWQGPSSPILPLGGDYAHYLSTLSPKVRANLRNRRRRLEKLGPTRVETVRGGPGLAAAIEEGFRIEAAAWKGDGGTAILSDPAVRRFYTGLAEVAAARGWLELRFLVVGERRIAFGFFLRYRGILYLLKQGYDPSLASYSPFNLLCQTVIEEAFADGLRALDFLGCEEDWKRAWTRESRRHRWLFVFSSTLRGRIAHSLKFGIAPVLRRPLAAMMSVLGGRP